MSTSVDLNAIVEQASGELSATLTQAQQTLAQAQQTLAAVDALAQKLAPVIDTVQAVLNEAAVVERDADGAIKSIHLHWPL